MPPELDGGTGGGAGVDAEPSAVDAGKDEGGEVLDAEEGGASGTGAAAEAACAVGGFTTGSYPGNVSVEESRNFPTKPP